MFFDRAFLMLANILIHKLNPEALTIAEDFSGMPGLCRPVNEGGYGFDYKMHMKICDKWKNFLMDIKDEEWNIGNILYTLTNRRYNENHISYAESHDQSFIGNYSLSSLLLATIQYSEPGTPLVFFAIQTLAFCAEIVFKFLNVFGIAK